MCSNTDDYALAYESIIRKAYNCKRGEIPGADASNYRELLTLYWNLMESIDHDKYKVKVAKEKFDKQCESISGYLKDAVDKFIVKYPNISIGRDVLPQTTIHGINIAIDKILMFFKNYNNGTD